MIKNKIDSSYESLDVLSQVYPWIPNSKTCRPSAETLKTKQDDFQIIDRNYILTEVCEKQSGWIFKPCKYRYNII